ncbi:calcium calmodulin-dependent kinase protein [Rutstroemia sp. NJR-2017a BVV2]|nr:calcium calmodulin-dependent kinase protein [Rutstroemia sp. NJR-2017a BVV2]
MEIFMDIQNSSLEDLLGKRTDPAFLQSLAHAVVVQMLFVLHHLEVARNILHRDIKPANILYTIEEGKYIFRLADFGLSKGCDDASAKSDLGTEFYKAPKVGNDVRQTPKMDIYSLYITLVNILNVENCRTHHVNDISAILKTARANGYPILKEYREMSEIWYLRGGYFPIAL